MAGNEPRTEPRRKKDPNEGEGNKTYARKYDKEASEFSRKGDVEGAARKAKKAVEGEESEELREAEREGKRHVAEEDPEVEDR